MESNNYSFLDEVKTKLQREKISAHMPGHKYKTLFNEDIWQFDSTEIYGLDNLHDAKGIIKNAEQFISNTYGSRESKILVGGSTAGILSAISASTGKILVPRDAHKSVFNAIKLKNLDFQTYNSIDEILEKSSQNIDTVVITTPSYYGKIRDISSLISDLKSKDILVIADEAHGAHLEFIGMSDLSALHMGADVVIQSAHKNLPSLTGTAMIHFNTSNLQYINTVKYYLTVYQTSSPSYPMMISTAEAVKYMDNNRENILDVSTYLLNLKNGALAKYLDNDTTNDPFKLFILAGKLGLHGHDLDNILRENGIFSEMANDTGVLLYLSCCNSIEEIDFISQTIIDNDKGGEVINEKYALPELSIIYDESTLEKRQVECIKLSEASGYVSLDTITIYPPASPVIIRGEILTEEIIANALCLIDKSTDIIGMADFENQMINVCKIEE